MGNTYWLKVVGVLILALLIAGGYLYLKDNNVFKQPIVEPKSQLGAAAGVVEATLGNTNIGTRTDDSNRNALSAFPFTASEAGTAISMSVYIANAEANSQYSLAIYADAGGSPGALIANTANQTISTTGWYTAPLAANLTAGTTYWLAYNTTSVNSGKNVLSYTDGAGTYKWHLQTFGNWPASFGTVNGTASNVIPSLYVTYTKPAPVTATGGTPSTTFTIGSTIVVSQGPINIRSNPSLTASIVGTPNTGAQGVILAGPTYAEGFNWWKVSYNNDAIVGWTTGAYQYTLVTSTTSTTATSTPIVATTTTPVVTATTTPIATTTAPTTGTGKFSLGDSVRVTRGPLNVRDIPSLRKPAKVLGTQATNAAGRVVGGPTTADRYTWWKIDYTSGADGWSTENYLTKTTAATTPVATTTPVSTTTAITPILSFTTTATGNVTLTQGTTGTVNVAVNFTQSNSIQTVTLAALNLPTGVTGTFNPATCLSVATGGSTCNITLGLAALGTAPAGTYNFMVAATGLGQTVTAPVSLTITAAGPVSTLFNLGDRVQATSNLNVRLTPSATAAFIPGAPVPAGSVGTITGLAQPGDGYAWWKVKFDNLATDGWSVQDFLALFIQIITPTQTPTTPDTAFDVGVNLEELTDYGDYTRAYMIVNVAKTWYQTQGTVGSDGWPNSASQFRVLTPVNADSPYSRPANVMGDYAIQVDGNVVITASGGTIKNLAYNSSTGKTTATLTVPDNLHDVNLGFSGSFKNAIVNRPGYPIGTTKVFTDEFKAAISPFKVLRLMDFMVTNRSLAPEEVAARAAMMGANGKLDWAERPNINAPRWRTAFGAPIELAVQLANETGKDLWINIPDYASDDYVTGLANYLKNNLNYNSKVYLEYSNETWNYAVFAQAGAMRSNAAAYAATGAAPTLDGQNNEYNAREYAMMQIIKVSNIFRNVFGDAAMPKTSTASDGPRIRPIFADQMGSPAPALGALNWAFRKYPQPVNYYIWGLAGAPYYTPLDRNATLDGLLNETTGGAANLNRRANWGTFINDQGQTEIDNKQAQYYGFAQAYGLKFVAYEGGWDGGQGLTNLDNKVLSAYDPRMEGITLAHVAQGYTNGMRLFVYFHLSGANSRSGQWGTSDNLRDEGSNGTSPKLKGLIKAATADPRTFEQAPISIATGYFGQNTSAPVGNGTGLTGTYYQNSSFSGTPAQVRIDPILNFYWTNYGSGNPFPRTDLIGGDVNRTGGFSVKWRGGFLPRFTGSYKFTLETLSDSVAFTLNGQNMITNPTISLTAGSSVPLSIDYVPSSAGFSTNGKVRLFVEINGGRKILVPQSYFLPTL